MVTEENPPSDDSEAPVTAELLEEFETFVPNPPPLYASENLAATGGAVGALVLGIWSVVSGFVSDWNIVNSGLAVGLGLWGMRSPRPMLALAGISLAALGTIVGRVW